MKLNDCKMSAIEVTYAGWKPEISVQWKPRRNTLYGENDECKDQCELFEQKRSREQKRVNGESIG